MNNKDKLANHIFFLSLLCIFVICSVIVVSYQINGYQTIVNENDKINNEHMPLAYLSNKVRANDIQDGIYTESIDNEDVLVIESKESKTYIYMYKNKLMELNAAKNYKLNFSDGDALFSIDSFHVEIDNHQLTFQIGINGEVKTMVIRMRGGSL
ncbi:MAG: DUF4860 domain-containing protein [Bacilli bacterium]|nr:DUF4860 domain-containing protein [Bacilli bacterium]